MDKTAGLLYGPHPHHLDHLAPLCSLLGIPLIIGEEDLAKEAKAYYPEVDIRVFSYMDLPEQVLKKWDLLFSTLSRHLLEEIFFFAEQIAQQKILSIWCPHGNSDKGHSLYFMEALQSEKAALVYGPKMIDFLIAKNAFSNLREAISIGNFRLRYFQKHLDFYRQRRADEIEQRLPSALRTYLYAPTWADSENSSSFFEAIHPLAETLPDHCNLIVKLHPNLLARDELAIRKIVWKYEKKPNILFLFGFPPIYPLLEMVDVYIGDMSSIGYDFLTFNKPMFFLNSSRRNAMTDPGLYLFRCGIEILPEQYSQIHRLIEEHLPHDQRLFSSVRKEVYLYTFGKERSWNLVREEILQLINDLRDNADFL